MKTERTLIQFLHDILVALASLDLKVPVGRDSMEHTLYRSVWCSGSSLHCLCYRQCLCDISNGYLLTWWNRSDWWRTDLKVCSLRWCPLLLCWQRQDITMNTVYHSCSCKHRLLAKTNSPLISSIRRTVTAEHEVVGSNPGWTTKKPGLQKPLYGYIFLLCSCITLASTSCKNVETLPQKKDLPCFKSLLVTGLWDIILTALLCPIESCSSKFWVWSCIASNFDKGWRGGSQAQDHGQAIYAKIRYSVSSTFATGCSKWRGQVLGLWST